MVYRKSKKSYPRRRRTYARTSGERLAIKALRGVKAIRGIINSEKKVHDISSSFEPTTTGTVIHLNPVSQGDTNTSRDGNSILAKYLGVRTRSIMHSTATATYIRYMIIQDTQQVSDTTPTIGDILQDVSVLSFYDRNLNVGRFKVLHDKVQNLDVINRWSGQLNFNCSLNHHTKFNGTAGSDIQKNGLYLVLLSNEATGTKPNVTYESRFAYYDN